MLKLANDGDGNEGVPDASPPSARPSRGSLVVVVFVDVEVITAPAPLVDGCRRAAAGLRHPATRKR